MTILGLELEDWWDLIKLLVSASLMTIALMFIGMLIHEGAHISVALYFGRGIAFFQFTGLLGAEVGIRAGSYLVPIVFAGAFAEGLYLLIVRRFIKSRGLWIATLSCWVYALAEVWWVSPPKGSPTAMLLLSVTRSLMYIIILTGLAWSRGKSLWDFSDYQKASVDLPVWVPSEHWRN